MSCAVPGCRREVELVYLDRDLCDQHWTEMNADDASRRRLRMVLGLDATTPPAVEETMSESETTNAAENAAEEVTMAAKKKATRSRAKKGPSADAR